jgi:general secretion pathway protein D
VKLCRFTVWAVLLPALAASEPSAADLFKRAQKAEKAGQTTDAYLLYVQAASKDPLNTTYWMKAQSLRAPAQLSAPSVKALDAKSEAPEAPAADAGLFGSISERELAEARRPLPPPTLKAKPGRQDFELRGDAKELFEKVAKAFDLLVVFDGGYQGGPAIRIRLTQVDYRDALRSLEAATNSFTVPASERVILVGNDNTAKRTELESTAAVVIPIPEPYTVQDAQEVVTAIRGTVEMQRIMIDTARRMVLIRDRIIKVRMAEKLFADLMRPRAQVAVEVELMTVDENSTLNYGLSLPTSFALASFGRRAANLISTPPSGFSRFLGFGGGASFIGIGITDFSLFATATKSISSSLLKSEVVAVDGLPATLHVGQRFPVLQAGYFGQTSGTTGTVFTPPPTVNFEDLGLVIKVTPHVHGTDDVSLDIEAEFKLLAGTSINDIPIIAERKFSSQVWLQEGEAAILAGLMTKSESKSISGIAGLSVIPFLRSNSKIRDRSETLIVLKPHLLISPPAEGSSRAAFIGSETRLRAEL